MEKNRIIIKLDSLNHSYWLDKHMQITHSYLGTARDGTKCLFFLLYEDYIDAQTSFARELDYELERFARNLGNRGALVRPFMGDIEETRTHILDKDWTPKQRSELQKTPSLLMINVDFDLFNPQQHPWFLLNFGDRVVEGYSSIHKFRELFHGLAKAINTDDVDIFKVAHSLKYEIQISDAAKVFEAKPGIFGFSIDLVRGGELLSQLYQRYVGRGS